jgi:hypothetical protein
VSWFVQAQDRSKWRVVVNKVMNIRVSQNAENVVTSRGHVSFSKRVPFQCRRRCAVRTFNSSLATGLGARYYREYMYMKPASFLGSSWNLNSSKLDVMLTVHHGMLFNESTPD